MKKIIIYFLLVFCIFLVGCDNLNSTYTVTFEVYGFVHSSIDLKRGDNVVFPSIISEGSRVKYWHEKGETTAFSPTTKITKDIILVAAIEEASIVTFHNSKVKDQYIYEGEKVIKPSDPTKTNYVFDGWYSDYDLTILFDFDKIFGYEQHIAVYAKWKEDLSPFRYHEFVANGLLYFEIGLSQYAKGEVTIPTSYHGFDIEGLYSKSVENEATKINIHRYISYIDSSFFILSAKLEEIKVDLENDYFYDVDGILFTRDDGLVFYPVNRPSEIYRTDAKKVYQNSFAWNLNIRYLFLNNVNNIGNYAFTYSNIKSIIISEGAEIGKLAFANYKGNIFLNDDSFDFEITSSNTVYLKGEWKLVDGIPVPNEIKNNNFNFSNRS